MLHCSHKAQKIFGGPVSQGYLFIIKCTYFDMDTGIVYSALSSVYSFKFDDESIQSTR